MKTIDKLLAVVLIIMVGAGFYFLVDSVVQNDRKHRYDVGRFYRQVEACKAKQGALIVNNTIGNERVICVRKEALILMEDVK